MKPAAIMIAITLMTSSRADSAQPDNSAAGRKVVVYFSGNNAVDLRIEAGAKMLAARMFSDIGINLNWRRGNPPQPEAGAIVVELATGTPATFKPGALAYALPYEGVRIRIFWDRIRGGPAPSQVLAHVTVHEITHILQGVKRHSAEGIMKAEWTQADFRAMAVKPLRFTADDVALIYLGLDSPGVPATETAAK